MKFNPKIIIASLLFAFLAILTAFFITGYCQIFYDLGINAKNRIAENQSLSFIFTPLFFWLSAYLCHRFALHASGGNLDHVRNALRILKDEPESFKKISPFLSFRIVVVNSISSLIAAFGGGSLGREGPSVQMSASIFAACAHRLRKFLPMISLENWILAGCGVGMSVAFASPAAGFVYVVEKLWRGGSSKKFHSNLIWTLLAVIVVSSCLYESLPIYITEKINFVFHREANLLILIAVVCGATAFIFNKSTHYFFHKFAAIKSNKWHLIPIICGILVSIIGFYGGVYSVGGGIKTVNDALASSSAFLTYGELFGRLSNTILTFIAGCAGGVVAPAIAIGANIGSIIGEFAPMLDMKIFILGGMVAFLSPVMGLPLTASIIILTSSAQEIDVLPFLLFVSFVSYFVERFITKYRKKSGA